MLHHIAKLKEKVPNISGKPFIDIVRDNEMNLFAKNYTIEILNSYPDFDTARKDIPKYDKTARF